jgi:hypothetical protein
MFRSLKWRSIFAFAALLTFSAGVTNAALASDIPIPTKAPVAPITPAPAFDSWTFSLTPYAWATSLSGTVTVKDHPTDIDASFFDILDHTQFPKGLFQASTFGEARYGRFAVLTDISYMKLGLGASLQRTRDIGKFIAAGVGISAGLTIQMVIAEVAAAYEVAHWSAANSNGTGTAFDIYAGARGWWQQGEVDFAVSGALAGLGRLD